MPNRLIIGVATFLVVNAALAFMGRGSIGHLFAVILLFGGGAVVGGVGAASLLLGRGRPEARRFAGRAMYTAAFAAGCFASLPLGSALNRSDIQAAKTYCDGLRPELERIRRETGRYPDHVLSNAVGARRPHLLRGQGFYHSSGDHYCFSFTDPSRIFSTNEFDSRCGEWFEVD